MEEPMKKHGWFLFVKGKTEGKVVLFPEEYGCCCCAC